MAGLTFANQSHNGKPSGGSRLWWVAVILIVMAVALITLYVRFDGGGAFATVRSGVQSVAKPVESVFSVISIPFDNVGDAASDEELEALETENEQLRTLVAELEEYRQQDERLTSLVELSDIYGLETIGAEVQSSQTGWNRTATIDKGTADGVKVGQGVISSCGLYGQVESVTESTAVVRLVNDADASTAAMVQSSHARGIVQGSYDGTLTLEYIDIDSTVGEGDIVITSGKGGVYPRGIILGTVSAVETDSSLLYYSLTVDPIYSIEDCEEVLVLTGEESVTESLIDEELLEEITSSSAASTDDEDSSASTDEDGDSSDDDSSEAGAYVEDDEDESSSDDDSSDEDDDDDVSGLTPGEEEALEAQTYAYE